MRSIKMKLYEEYISERFVNPQEELGKLKRANLIGQMLRSQGVELGKGLKGGKEITQLPTTKQLPQTQPMRQPQAVKQAFSPEETARIIGARNSLFAKWRNTPPGPEKDALYKLFKQKNDAYVAATQKNGRAQ